MNDIAADTLSVIVEREFPYPPEKLWRALTQPHLIAEWLMQNDFQAVPQHAFKLTADWGSVNCEVTLVEPNRKLAYTWAAMGVDTIVTWTLAPTDTGTRLRMEQAGFRPDQQQAFNGAKYGWQNFFNNLERTLER